MNRRGHVDFGAPSGGITTSDIHRGLGMHRKTYMQPSIPGNPSTEQPRKTPSDRKSPVRRLEFHRRTFTVRNPSASVSLCVIPVSWSVSGKTLKRTLRMHVSPGPNGVNPRWRRKTTGGRHRRTAAHRGRTCASHSPAYKSRNGRWKSGKHKRRNGGGGGKIQQSVSVVRCPVRDYCCVDCALLCVADGGARSPAVRSSVH